MKNAAAPFSTPTPSGPLGPRGGLQWIASPTHVDMSLPLPPPRPLTLPTAP